MSVSLHAHLRGRYLSMLALFVRFLFLTPFAATAQTPLAGSIHGQVAAVLPAPPAAVRVALTRVFVPGIEVWAKDARTGAAGPHVVTNAEGYFRTLDLPFGTYNLCFSGKGYASTCDDEAISLVRPTAVASHILQIRPEANVVHGTVWLADRTTPCFWFSPATSPQPLTAQVTVLTSDGKVVAGPVSGNASGQFVLPLGDIPAGARLSAKCDEATADVALPAGARFAAQDIALSNHKPTILAFDLSQNGTGIRRADPGATVTATVQTSDLDNDTLHYRWVDDSGRTLALPDAPTVQWQLPTANAFNTLHVQVTDGRGGFATANKTVQAGPNALTFTGHVFNRQGNAPIAGASVAVNGTKADSDPSGSFRVVVPDAAQFVLNVSKPGFALNSQVLHTIAVNIPVPMDAVQNAPVDGGTGGVIGIGSGPGPGSGKGGTCDCHCAPGQQAGDNEKVVVQTDDTRVIVERLPHGGCGAVDPTGAGNLGVTFPANAFVTTAGAPYTGPVLVEGLQYDLTQDNPIPGDYGAIYQGKTVRLASFGAFHILPRDAAGNPLAMAPGKTAQVSLPIQSDQRAAAPATIPFFHYDEATGLWLEDGTLTRSGDRYVGAIQHFSVFNADTQFGGGACVKILLDASFTFPVTLSATYYDAAAGTFHHNGTTTSDQTVGVERMTPDQNFTLSIKDSETPPHTVSVVLYSGPGLSTTAFPSGYDSDPNFSHCNGPVQVYNNVIPPTEPFFLGQVFGPDPIADNSAAYQAATQAGTGQPRNTLNGWKTLNGFPTDGSPISGEAKAVYFNNGDLKFGRDMHCHQTSATTKATACYVSNFGAVGTDDATTAMPQAEAYEAGGQGFTNSAVTLPGATVAMEYDPVKGVQFFAYKNTLINGKPDGTYFPKPALDDELGKPMPDICMACHQGSYSGNTNVNNGANFLPFDIGSFLNDAGNTFPSAPPTAAVQEQFRLLNSMVAQTAPPSGVTEVIDLWYHSHVGTSGTVFDFTQGAAGLPSAPFAGHEPLYDLVVTPVCRTCHTSVGGPLGANPAGLTWDTFAQMTGHAQDIQSIACGPNYQWMPHAQVPWKRFWQDSLSSTLSSELLLQTAGSTEGGCPKQ